MRTYACRMTEQEQKEYWLFHRLAYRLIPAEKCSVCDSTVNVERHFIWGQNYIRVVILCHAHHDQTIHHYRPRKNVSVH